MSIGCIAVDRHDCAQMANLKYLDFYDNWNWSQVVFADNIGQLDLILENKVIIYIKKYQQASFESTFKPFTNILIILEEDSQLDLIINKNSNNCLIQILMPEPGATFNCYFRAIIKEEFGLNIECDQIANNTKVLINGKFIVNKQKKLLAFGKIKMHNTAFNSSSELYLKALREDAKSVITVSPILEVLNKNVTAKHGSAILTIEKQHVWPFIVKGISYNKAASLLKNAFLKGL